MNCACPVCGEALQAYRHAWLTRCCACGVLRAELPVTIPAERSNLSIDETVRWDGLDALRRRNNVALLAAISKLTPPGAKLLDVGSGPGFLLAQARARGFEVLGVEPDANTVGEARHGYFPDVLRPREKYDVIVFNDVLEHIPDLVATLQAASRHLRADGILCLNCPDQHGFFFQTAALLDRLGISGPYDRMWQRGLPSPHVWYFTPAHLQRVAVKFNLRPEGCLPLASVELNGLWSRIRAARNTSWPVSVASFGFATVIYPFSRLLPSDAVACFFRKTR
jgi:SAM-dependent methyltransferase